MGAAKSSKELDTLKEQAKELGITFSPNIGLDALQKKIDIALGSANAEETSDSEPSGVKEETSVQKTINGIKDATKLHRVIVACVHPDKVDLKVEVISVGNTKYGFVSRAIPFNTPWHVEDIIYKYLKSKTFFKTTVTSKTVNGARVQERKTEELQEYNVQDLPPLTKDELAKLALDQTASGRLLDN